MSSKNKTELKTTGRLFSVPTHSGKDMFHITLSAESSEELVKLGFKDMENVALTIEKLKHQ